MSDFFPFKSIRDEQRTAIKFAIDSFKTKKFVILEMGTGCGKSATAISIARHYQNLFETNQARLGGSYILTTQKVLQEQYLKDFGKPSGVGDLKLIKSANSYCCKLFVNSKFEEQSSCAEIQRLLSSEAPMATIYSMCQQKCVFKDAKNEFMNSPEGITNYAYFLGMTSYSNEVQRRGLLILDEAHNIENVVSSFVKISFSNFFYKTVLGVKTPHANAKQETVYEWLVNVCRPRLRDVIRTESKKVVTIKDPDAALELAKKLENLKRNFSKIEKFVAIYDPNVWVLDQSKSDKRGERIYEFKPITVKDYCSNMLFDHCDKVLMLSATILDVDVFCNSLGIDKNDVAFLRIPSPFPANNRPIHYFSVGSMSKNAMTSTMPKMAEVIKSILEQHSLEKGIIHCGNFKIAKELHNIIGNDRLLIHDSENREEVIKFHMKTPAPSVLLSPSMTEGVDLADDASRFQIICKIPFPYLGDSAVQKRMTLDDKWYAYQTVKTIVQSLGRSIRNESDYATSYILDSDWFRFYSKNEFMFPPEFKSSFVT